MVIGHLRGLYHIQVFLRRQFQVRQRPDGLLEGVQVCEEVTGDENEDHADDSCDGVADARAQKERQEQSDADDDARNEQNHECIDEDPERNDQEQDDQENNMPQVAHDQLETASNGGEDALLSYHDAFLCKAEQKLEGVRDEKEPDGKVDAGKLERRVDVPKNQRARRDERGKAAEHQKFMNGEDRQEIIEREHQAAAHVFFSVRFCSQSDDGTQAEVRHEEFDDNQCNKERNDREEFPERHAVVDVNFDVEESHFAASAEVFVRKIDLIHQQFQVQECFEKRGCKRPPADGHFSRRDSPGFRDDFTWSHWGVLYWKEGGR